MRPRAHAKRKCRAAWTFTVLQYNIAAHAYGSLRLLQTAGPLASSDTFPGAVGVLNPFEKLSGLSSKGAHGLARLKGRPFLLGAGGIEYVDFGGGSAHVGGGVLDRNFVVSLSTAACALSSGAAAARAAARPRGSREQKQQMAVAEEPGEERKFTV